MNDFKAVMPSSDAQASLQPNTSRMAQRLCGHWWVFVVRGALALLFAGFTLLAGGMLPSPLLRALALTAIVLMFAAYFFLSAIFDLVVFAEEMAGAKRSLFLIFDAVVGIGLCVSILSIPTLEIRSLLYFLGAYAVISGTLEWRIALRTRRYFHTWAIAAAGISVAAMGVVLLALRLTQMQVMVHVIALSAFYTGLVRIATGIYFRYRQESSPST